MFVRSLNNSTARILMAFILARTALDVKELRDWTGMKRETIYGALDELKSIGKVEKQVLAHGRTVWLPAGDLLPGFFQMSEKRTPALQESVFGTPSLVGGESINSELNIDSLNPQMSEKGTSVFPSVVEILSHTDLLFDGALVMSRGLEGTNPLHVLAWCAYAFSQKGRMNGGAGGVVRNRLKDNEVPPEAMLQRWQDVLPHEFLEALGLIDYHCEDCQATFKKIAELEAHQATHGIEVIPVTVETDESLTVLINGRLTAEQAWQSVLDQLQQDMPRASFDSYLRDTRVHRYDGNALQILAGSIDARDWLQGRLASSAARLLIGVLSREVTVEFVVAEGAA
jgi:hypothetical protein